MMGPIDVDTITPWPLWIYQVSNYRILILTLSSVYLRPEAETQIPTLVTPCRRARKWGSSTWEKGPLRENLRRYECLANDCSNLALEPLPRLSAIVIHKRWVQLGKRNQTQILGICPKSFVWCML